MCGIIGGFNSNIVAGVDALRHRGPDGEGIIRLKSLSLGHTRLSILDLHSRSNQPFQYGSVALVYNGELWNYRELRSTLEKTGLRFGTTGDTEVLAAALSTWGVEALPRLDGMFAAGWTDDGGETVYLVRDKFGEIPLHYTRELPFLFASEEKALLALGATPASIKAIPPGCWMKVGNNGKVAIHKYYKYPNAIYNTSRENASHKMRELLRDGVRSRIMSDVPICTMLSGGIDSTAIVYLLSTFVPDIVAYTAVHNPKSRDLRCAEEAAESLGIELRKVPIPTPTAEDLGKVIDHIEMPTKVQVEIGWACLKLAEAMQADGFKVTFSGEASDELWGSYRFAYFGIRKDGWYKYRQKLFASLANKNFPRNNKIFMSHSVECRTPFCHAPLVEYALSLSSETVRDRPGGKNVLQDAFRGIIPNNIANRPKVAFQDGLGLKQSIAEAIPEAGTLYKGIYNRKYRPHRQRGMKCQS